jgi:maltose alpha-D-glucosyltransferase/alpha-amylase
VPPLAGALEYHRDAGEPATLAILQEFVANQGDAWSYTLDWLERFFQAVSGGRKLERPPTDDPLSLSAQAPSSETRAALGDYLDSARLLGRRTAELHLALGGRSSDPSFAPEPFTASYRRSLNRSLRNLTAQVFRQLRERLSQLPAGVRAGAERVLAQETELLERFSELGERKLSGRRILGHGEYHLGQVLYTGEDFVIIDFEGEPARPLRERRIKHSPLRDVAGMLRSFHYAAYARLAGAPGPGTARVEDFARLEPAARFWYLWSSAAFLSAYFDVAHVGGLLARSRAELSFLLEVLILEKAIYELGYELNHRPAWLKIPTQAVLEALEPKTTEAGRDVPPRGGQDGELK